MTAEKKRTLLMIFLLAAAAAAAIAGYLLLPDTLTTQIGVTGSTSGTMPKALGLAVPFALTAIFSVLYHKAGDKKHLLVAVVGIIASGLLFVFNL